MCFGSLQRIDIFVSQIGGMIYPLCSSFKLEEPKPICTLFVGITIPPLWKKNKSYMNDKITATVISTRTSEPTSPLAGNVLLSKQDEYFKNSKLAVHKLVIWKDNQTTSISKNI